MENVRFTHPSFSNAIDGVDRRMTFAYKADYLDNGDMIVKGCFAVAAPADNFCRRTGRNIAMGRLEANSEQYSITVRSEVGGRRTFNSNGYQATYDTQGETSLAQDLSWFMTDLSRNRYFSARNVS